MLVLNQLEGGGLSNQQATALLQVSDRQVRLLRAEAHAATLLTGGNPSQRGGEARDCHQLSRGPSLGRRRAALSRRARLRPGLRGRRRASLPVPRRAQRGLQHHHRHLGRFPVRGWGILVSAGGEVSCPSVGRSCCPLTALSVRCSDAWSCRVSRQVGRESRAGRPLGAFDQLSKSAHHLLPESPADLGHGPRDLAIERGRIRVLKIELTVTTTLDCNAKRLLPRRLARTWSA